MMKFFAPLFLIILFAVQISAQNGDADGRLAQTSPEILTRLRIEKIKNDVLQDISAQSRPNQAYYYVRLGDIYRKHDADEGLKWMKKGVELGIASADEYPKADARLRALWRILNSVLGRDAALAADLIAKIKTVKVDESDLPSLKDANDTYILIAQQILTRSNDQKTALEFARLSLQGKKPAIGGFSARFLWALRARDKALPDWYFSELIGKIKTTGDRSLLFGLYRMVDYQNDNWYNAWKITDQQQKLLFEASLPFIEREVAQLKSGKIDSCGTTKYLSEVYLSDFKRVFPEQASVLEQAVGVCVNAPIPVSKKPSSARKPLKSTQDYLDYAKTIDNRTTQATYLMMASQTARFEKNFRLSNEILDGIDKEFRQNGWVSMKIQTLGAWADRTLSENDPAAVEKILSLAPEYEHFVIVRCLYSYFMPKPDSMQKPEQKDFIFNLLNRARAGFNRIGGFFPVVPDFMTNPTQFAELPMFYLRFGYLSEAVTVHEEAVKALNRWMAALPADENKLRIGQNVFSYSRFSNGFPPSERDFYDQYFDRIYASLSRIEISQIRLRERLEFLDRFQQARALPATRAR